MTKMLTIVLIAGLSEMGCGCVQRDLVTSQEKAVSIANAYTEKHFPSLEAEQSPKSWSAEKVWLVKYFQVRGAWSGSVTVVVDKKAGEVLIAFPSTFGNPPKTAQ